MNIEQLVFLSNMFLGVGILFCVISSIIYYKLDIYRAWHIVTGRKLVEKKHFLQTDRFSQHFSQKLSTKKLKAIEKLVMPSNSEQLNKTEALIVEDSKNSNSQEEKTEVLNNTVRQTELLKEDAQTDLLYKNQSETVVLQDNETTILERQQEVDDSRITEELSKTTILKGQIEEIGKTEKLNKCKEDALETNVSNDEMNKTGFHIIYDVTLTHSGVKK